jgi:hypothetical protein
MGRQLAIFLTIEDEHLLLDYLTSIGDIVILTPSMEKSTGKIEDYITSSFSADYYGNWVYWIWNKRFIWKPEFRWSDFRSNFYFVNVGSAPIIEYCRSNVKEDHVGRIYWSKYFSAPNGLEYDVKKFSEWYDTLMRWIIKTAAGKTKYSNLNTYYLPDAWKEYNDRKVNERKIGESSED